MLRLAASAQRGRPRCGDRRLLPAPTGWALRVTANRVLVAQSLSHA
jgi:hypothetical protein